MEASTKVASRPSGPTTTNTSTTSSPMSTSLLSTTSLTKAIFWHRGLSVTGTRKSKIVLGLDRKATALEATSRRPGVSFSIVLLHGAARLFVGQA